jgi:2',3'-cyclic-nucleotide 2'-phosphodiesterase / 3'-nucleotidase
MLRFVFPRSARPATRRAFAGTILALTAALCLSAVRLPAAERAVVTVLSTTDLHAHINPVDYYTGRPEQGGLAKLATLIRQARREQPDLVLVDCGDTIQGTPLGYFHARKNNAPPDPMMLAMSALGFDAMTLGNHEFNFGPAVREKARREAAFPWLSANSHRTGTSEPAFVPFIIKEVNGVRVGVLGITTPGIPAWENPENYAGLDFADPVSETARWVRALRERERVDVVVAAVHMGLEENLRTGELDIGVVPNENAALAIARAVPGIDLMLMGHTHREISALEVNGVLIAQAGRWGDRLVRADLYLEREAAGHWQRVARTARTIPITEKVEADSEIVKLIEPYENETQAWLGRQIGECAAELSAADSRLRDTAIIDLINRVQLEAGQADVSMAASFNLNARVSRGPVTVRDIAGLYVYENTLVVIEVTGAQLREALEHSARYFLPYEPGRTKSAADLVDSRMPGYNFDLAEGVSYDIDLARPPGQRIVNLTFQGQPLDPARKLRLAVNNYRRNGGGGYSMYKNAPVLMRFSTEIRDLIIDWVERNKTVPAEATDNWRLLFPAVE